MPGSFPGVRGRHSGIEVVPDAVRRARQEAGLSQAQVAEPQYTRAAIHQVEAGKIRPTLRLLRQIAQRTGRPVSYFLAKSRLTAEEREVVDHLHRLVDTGAFTDAIAFGEDLLLGRELPREIEAEARFLVGRAYVRSADGTRAYPHLVKAQTLYEGSGDEYQLAEVLNQTACALFLLDDIRSLAIANQALDICERLRQTDLLVRTLIVVGMILKRLQDWNRAINCYARALEQIGTSLGIRNLAMTHDQLSQCYQRVGRFGDALQHARKAMKLYRGSLDPTDWFRSEHNLGETLLRQGELRAARPHLERALDLFREHDLRRYFGGYALLSMSELHIACDELDDAEALLSEARDLVDQLGERNHQATLWRLRGRLHLLRGEFASADNAFVRAAAMFNDLQYPVDLFDVQVEHARGLRAQGRVEEALELSLAANSSGQVAVRRVQGGWGDIVAANWRR